MKQAILSKANMTTLRKFSKVHVIGYFDICFIEKKSSNGIGLICLNCGRINLDIRYFYYNRRRGNKKKRQKKKGKKTEKQCFSEKSVILNIAALTKKR